MSDSSLRQRNYKVGFRTFSVLDNKGDSKTEGDAVKGHGSRFERALIRQIWDNLITKITNERNKFTVIIKERERK